MPKFPHSRLSTKSYVSRSNINTIFKYKLLILEKIREKYCFSLEKYGNSKIHPQENKHYVYSFNETLLSNENEPTDATTWMNLKNTLNRSQIQVHTSDMIHIWTPSIVFIGYSGIGKFIQ